MKNTSQIKKLSEKIKVVSEKLAKMREELKQLKEIEKQPVVSPAKHYKKAAKKKVGRKKKSLFID